MRPLGTVLAMARRPRRLALTTGVAATALLTGCASNAPQDSWDPAGDNAQKIHNLQWPVFAIAGVVLVIVCAVVLFCIVKFRDRGQAIPEQSHGDRRIEIVLTILPALILAGIAIPTVGTLMALNKTDDTECTVNVTGQQWWWEIDYPAQDGCSGITEPIVTSGQLVIPTGQNVMIRGTSRDVIHSFWVGRLNGKRDFVPGRIHTLRMQADEPGIYAGQCAEFCGLSHANMRMEVVALNAADFEAWKNNQYAPAAAPAADDAQALAGQDLFVNQCARCHQVNGLSDSNGEPVIAQPENNVYAGSAPNLTHLMSRNTFAGATFDLLSPECRDNVWEADPESFGQRYLEGVSASCLNEVDLREWLRNAPEKKPMYADPTRLAATNGLPRGMPYLALSEEQINQLIAYLLTLH